MSIHTATIADHDGAEHKYVILPHQGLESIPITLAFASKVIPLLGALSEGTDRDTIEADLAGVDQSALFSRLGAAVGEFKPALIKLMFAHTNRDGQPLALKDNFDRAFTQNHLEMLLALKEIVQHNGWIPLGAISTPKTPEAVEPQEG